jgi:hypothetical protein
MVIDDYEYHSVLSMTVFILFMYNSRNILAGSQVVETTEIPLKSKANDEGEN